MLRVVLCAVIKILGTEKLRVASKTLQAIANIAPTFVEIFSDSVFHNRTVQQGIHISSAQLTFSTVKSY